MPSQDCHARAHDPNTGKKAGLFGLAKSNKAKMADMRGAPQSKTVHAHAHHFRHIRFGMYFIIPNCSEALKKRGGEEVLELCSRN